MKESWVERTEQYVDNEMTAAERTQFEAEMTANEELSSYVKLYQEIETTMQGSTKNYAAEEALKDSLKKLNASYFLREIQRDGGTPAGPSPGKSRSGKKRNPRAWIFFAVAAAIIGIIATVAIRNPQNKKNGPIAHVQNTDTTKSPGKTATDSLQEHIASNPVQPSDTGNNTGNQPPSTAIREKQEKLFAENFTPDDPPAITEGPLEDAFNYYADKNYDDAVQEFGDADRTAATRGLETNPQRTAFYAEYYAGISYLAMKQNSKAISSLHTALAKSPDDISRIKLQWYLALAYLAAGDTSQTDGLLEKISANTKETAYKAKASRLRAALK